MKLPELHITNCPRCDGLAIVYHELVIHFQDAKVLAIVCQHCTSISAFVADLESDVWQVVACPDELQEHILGILEGDRKRKEQATKQVEQFQRYNKKPRWN